MKLKITFLGTSAAVPTIKRSLPAIAFQWKGKIMLFDAGEGVQRQMLKSGLSILRVKQIFITHSHGDHVLGVFGLLHTMAMLGRESLLEIYAPRDVIELITSVTKYTGRDPAFKVILKQVHEGIIFEGEDYLIKAFKVDHGTLEAYGYVFEETKALGKFDVKKAEKLGIPKGPLWKMLQEGKDIVLENGRIIRWREVVVPPKHKVKVVYTGDTKPLEKTIEYSKDATVLIHDSTFDYTLSKEAHEQGHSTSLDAALIAKKANVKTLFLTHISARYESEKPLLEKAVEIFKNTYVAQDFMSVWVF